MFILWYCTNPLNIEKAFESPNIIFGCIKIQIVIYQENILIISQSIKRLLVTRDKVIFLLQHLGLMVNFKNLGMEPVQTMKYLGLVIDSIQTTNRREKGKTFSGVPNNTLSVGDIRFAVNKIGKSSIIHHTSSSPSPNLFLLPKASKSVSSKKRYDLPREKYSKQ